MTKATLDQKRLEALRRQLYGKPDPKRTEAVSSTLPSQSYNFAQYNKEVISKNTTDNKTGQLPKSEFAYLKKDLLKILSLSSLALSAQLLLYLATRNGLLVL